MARHSHGTQRVVALLNFFASHPGQAFSLTDILRALKFNRATLHAILAELVTANYLYRTSDKLYVLGPAIAEVGRVANLHLSPLQVALPEMRALSDEFDIICSAIFREGHEVVIRERTASVSHLDWSLPRGARWPLRPPFAASFLAWLPAAEAETWLDTLEPAASPAERERTHEAMAFARRHGFQFGTRSIPPEQIGLSTEWLFVQDPAQRPVQLATELEDGAIYDLASLSSPVFDSARRVAFVLGVSGFNEKATGAQVAAIGARVRQSCQRVTQFLGGIAEGTAGPLDGIFPGTSRLG